MERILKELLLILQTFMLLKVKIPDSTVFIATIQGNLNPGGVTDNANFDEDVLIEFNIDNTGDLVEDLSYPGYQTWRFNPFFGPVVPNQTGVESQIITTTIAQCGANIY